MFFMANTILISTSALVGLALAPVELLATLPLGAQFLGSMCTTLPASYLMRAIGRRRGLACGCLLGVTAGALAATAVVIQSFLLFVAASLIYGGYSAFCQYYRFTAADAADAARSGVEDTDRTTTGRAIALVMAGGVVAAVIGPELAKAAQDLVAGALFAGGYLIIALLGLVSLAALLCLDLPHRPEVELAGAVRPARVIFAQPAAITALLSAIVAYVVMNLLMTATPLAMRHEGHPFADTAFVIQWHVVGMFAPSFFTGSLIARFGEHRIVAAGAVLLLTAVGVNLAGVAVAHFTLGLLFLGLGWNFMFIGGTTLLTRCYRPAEKAKAQGINDLVLFSTVALSAFSSGALHQTIGWHVMNLAVLPLLLVSLAATLLAHTRATRPLRTTS